MVEEGEEEGIHVRPSEGAGEEEGVGGDEEGVEEEKGRLALREGAGKGSEELIKGEL